MATGATPQKLNGNQCRLLLAVIWRVDELLASVERALDASSTPFPRLVHDLPPGSDPSLRQFVATARSHMVTACFRLGVRPPEPTITAVSAVTTALEFASDAFADIEPATMRGYGPVSDALARELRDLSGSLQALMLEGIEVLGDDAIRPPQVDRSIEGGP